MSTTAKANFDAIFQSAAESKPTEVKIDLIQVSPQVRKEFDDADNTIEDLAASIRQQGVLQPLLLRQRGARFELVAGERRLRAAKLAGLKVVPCLVRTFSDAQKAAAQLAENIHRKNLTQIEEAQALKASLDGLQGDRQALLKTVNKSESWLSQRLNLLTLTPEARRLIDENLSADTSAIQSVSQLERIDPRAAKALVDQQAARTLQLPLRQAATAATKASKAVKDERSGKPSKAGPSGPMSVKPLQAASGSVATARDAAQQRPSNGGAIPVAMPKPAEQAAVNLLELLRTMKNPAEAVSALKPADLRLINQQGKVLFERGRKAGLKGASRAIVHGMRSGDFGKSPAELVNLLAFLQGATGQGTAFDLTGAGRAFIP